jgi:hypothetical protein
MKLKKEIKINRAQKLHRFRKHENYKEDNIPLHTVKRFPRENPSDTELSINFEPTIHPDIQIAKDSLSESEWNSSYEDDLEHRPDQIGHTNKQPIKLNHNKNYTMKNDAFYLDFLKRSNLSPTFLPLQTKHSKEKNYPKVIQTENNFLYPDILKNIEFKLFSLKNRQKKLEERIEKAQFKPNFQHTYSSPGFKTNKFHFLKKF